MPRFLVLRCALFAVATPLTAQIAGVLPNEGLFVHAWPETVVSGQLHALSAQACRFDPASPVDAVVLRAHEVGAGETSRVLYTMRNVAGSHACVSLGAAADFAVVSLDDGAEGVVALGNDGSVRLIRWSAGQLTPSSQTLTAWPGFRHISAVPNGSTTELVGYDSSGIRIKRATWSGSQLGPTSQHFVAQNVTYVAGMDWNHDGVLEFVLGTPAATYVNAWNMAPVATLPVVPPTAAITVFTRVSHATTGDQLVTVAWDGTQTVMTCVNSTTNCVMPLGDRPVGAMAVYDRDGDGDEDILLGDAEHSVVRVLQRDAAGYTLLEAPLLVGTAAADRGIAALCGRDLDGDGDGDVLAWNSGTMKVHTLLDALREPRRPLEVHGDVANASVGATVAIDVAVSLPRELSQLEPTAQQFRVRLIGWLADPVTGIVLPQRAVDQELAFAPTTTELLTQVTFALPAAHQGRFHLQLQTGVVAVLAGGERRMLPTMLVHLTNDVVREAALRLVVEQERTGNLTGGSKPGDGGGDGNILGTKTGKHEVGAPPQ